MFNILIMYTYKSTCIKIICHNQGRKIIPMRKNIHIYYMKDQIRSYFEEKSYYYYKKYFIIKVSLKTFTWICINVHLNNKLVSSKKSLGVTHFLYIARNLGVIPKYFIWACFLILQNLLVDIYLKIICNADTNDVEILYVLQKNGFSLTTDV